MKIFISIAMFLLVSGPEMDARMLTGEESGGVTTDAKICNFPWEVKKSWDQLGNFM